MAKIISLKIKCFLNKSFFKKTVLQMYLDEIVGYIIGEYYKQNGEHQKVMSRSKMPCTRCRCLLSATWRPGPCGTSSLCNACGLLYMIRNQRPRMIDLVISDGRVIWMERRSDSLRWQESSDADMKDPRVKTWFRQEEERLQFIESKKRKFVDL